jgi:hypothetical protein
LHRAEWQERKYHMKIVEDAKWQEERLQTMGMQYSPTEILALSYLVMETLEPLIKNKTKIYYEQANSYLVAYNFCKKALAKIRPLCINMPEYHDWLFSFFSKELFNNSDVLTWWFDAPNRTVSDELKVK